MLFAHKSPDLGDARALIGVSTPDVFARTFYAAAQEKNGKLKVQPAQVELAHEFGKSISSIAELREFYVAVTPMDPPSRGPVNVIGWAQLTAEVAISYLKQIGTVAEAIELSGFLRGYDIWNNHFEELENDLVTHTLPFLTTFEERIAFAGALKTYGGRMTLAVGLGYKPDTVFEEAVNAHRARMERLEKQQAYSNYG